MKPAERKRLKKQLLIHTAVVGAGLAALGGALALLCRKPKEKMIEMHFVAREADLKALEEKAAQWKEADGSAAEAERDEAIQEESAEGQDAE